MCVCVCVTINQHEFLWNKWKRKCKYRLIKMIGSLGLGRFRLSDLTGLGASATLLLATWTPELGILR